MNTEEKAEKRLAVRVTKTIKDAFDDKARMLGKTESQVLMALVLQFIDGEVEIENNNLNDRLHKLEQEIEMLKRGRVGELLASGTKIAS